MQPLQPVKRMEHQISRIIAEFEANTAFREKILPLFYQEEILSEEDRQQYNESADEYHADEEIRDRRRHNIVRKIIRRKQRLLLCCESVFNEDPEVHQTFQKIKEVLSVQSYRNCEIKTRPFKEMQTQSSLDQKPTMENVYLPKWNISSTLPTCSVGLSKSEIRRLQKLKTLLNQANLRKFTSLIQVMKDKETVSANILYKLCYYQANRYLYTSETKKCSKLLKRALSMTGKTSNPRRFDIEVFSVQAWLYLSSNKMGKCYNAIQNALQLALCDPAGGSHKALGWVYYFKSSFHAKLSDLGTFKDILKFREMAKDSLKHAIDQFQREENESFRCGYCYVKLAKLLLGCGRNLQTVNYLISSCDIEEAYHHLKKVENLKNGVDNVLHIAYDQALSDLYYRMGNYQRAYEKASEALRKIRKYGINDDENEIEIRLKYYENLKANKNVHSDKAVLPSVPVTKLFNSYVDELSAVPLRSKRKRVLAMKTAGECKRQKYDDSICSVAHIENAS